MAPVTKTSADRRLRLVLDEQERERADVAQRLHEQLAQSLAGVMLGLDALGRCLDAGDAARITGLRAEVAGALATCTELAVGLRPPVLAQLGLAPALRALGERKGARRVTVDAALARAQLEPALATEVYRLGEEALRAVEPDCCLSVSFEPGRELRLLAGPLPAHAPTSALARLAARLELLDGTLRADSRRLDMRIPLDATGSVPTAGFPQARRVETPDGRSRALP